MDPKLQRNLGLFSDRALLTELSLIRRGIEREALRVRADGSLSPAPHPQALGSPLCHPCFTTDFSEAMLEIVTPTVTGLDQLMSVLEQLHRLAAAALEPAEELLWASSIPCHLGATEEQIPIADYGPSYSGQMRALYRKGLAYRYGRRMQMVTGIHYNFSLPITFWPHWQKICGGSSDRDITTESYFGMIRNCRRHAWLPVLLSGASPVVDGSFLSDRKHHLRPLGTGDYGLEAATSLRLSAVGYYSEHQQTLSVSANNLDDYVHDLLGGILKPCATYRNLEQDGQLVQLNDGILQIENEYYGVIRPKRPSRKGEPSLKRLSDEGVEYLELRLLDLDIDSPLGISESTLSFIDAFLLHCLLSDSPPTDSADRRREQANLNKVVERGRQPQLQLDNGDGPRSLDDWAQQLMTEIAAVAEILDTALNTDRHRLAVATQAARLREPSQLPSAQIVSALKDPACNHQRLILSRSREHTDWLRQQPATTDMQERHRRMVADSRTERHRLEQESQGGFDRYLKQYFAGYRQLDKQSARGTGQ